MGSSKKRKRDVLETPRITYDTPTRIFDRLFKEDSLDELKDTVRKKLGVPSSTAIHLTQLRDGTAVDLEDDDDFDAFQSAAYSALVARVKVVVGDSDQPVHTNGVEEDASQSEVVESISSNKQKTKEKKKSIPDPSRAATPTTAPIAEDAPDVDDERLTKKRRVSFAAPSTEFHSSMTEPKNREKWKNTDKPGKSTDSATSPAAEPSNVLSAKQKRKKKKKTASPEADASEEPAKDEEPVVEKTSDGKKKKGKDKDVDATDASGPEVITDTEAGRKGSKSKKRARSRSPDRPIEISEAGPSISTVAETPLRAAKKSKKPTKDVDTTQGDDSEPAPTPSASAAAEPAPESPSVPPKDNKEKKKAASKDTEKPADSALPASSSAKKGAPVVDAASTMDKKLKKKKSNANFETEKTSEFPPPAGSKGGKRDSSAVKAPENAEPATSAKKSSKESTDAAAGTTSATAKPTSKAVSMEEQSNAMAAKILVRLALKELEAAEKGVATTSKTTKPTASKAAATIEATSPKESAASVPAPETTKPAPTKASAAIEASSSKESTTTTDTNSSKTAKPAASKPAQDKPAAVKAPRLTPAQRKKSPCPVCGESPFHARSRCPLIKEGVRAMRKRIKELEESNAEEHVELIEELRALIDKKTKKTKAPAVNGVHAQTEEHTDAHAEVGNGTSKSPENTVAAVPSTKAAPAIPKASAKAAQRAQPEPPEPQSSDEEESPPAEPSRSPSPPTPAQPRPTAPKSPAIPSKGPTASSSQKQQQPRKSIPKKSEGYDRDSSQLLDTSDVSLAAIGLPGGLLGFGAEDVSTFTEADIEALIRGPRPSLNSRNLASSSSSSGSEDEDEDELGVDVVMEEEEEKSDKAQRAARRMSKMAARGDSSDEVVAVGVRGQEQEDDGDSDDSDDDSSAAGDVTLQRNVIAALKVHPSVTPSARASEDVPNESSPSPSTSSHLDTRAGEHSFRAVNGRATSQVLDTSVSDVVNNIISADIGIVSPEPDVEDEGQVDDDSQESKAEAEPITAQVDTNVLDETAALEVAASEEPEPVTADSPSSESSENSADTNEADPIEVEAPQPSQGDPIHSDADEDNGTPALAESTPNAKVTTRQTRSQRSKAEPATTTTASTTTAGANPPSSTLKPRATAVAPAASSQLSQSGSRSEPPKVSRKSSRPMTKISEMPVPPHPNSGIRVIKPAQVAVVARSTRSKSAAASEPAEDKDDGGAAAPETEAEPEPSIALMRGRRAGSVVPKTPAKPIAAKTPAKVKRTASKQALTSSQTPAPITTAKAAPKTSAKPPSKVGAKGTVFTRTTAKERASQLTADLEEESDNGEEGEEQNITINGHVPAQGGKKAGDQSVASWSFLPDRSSVGADLAAITSSPTRNMVDELASSSRAATPKVRQASQQVEPDAQEGDGEGTEEAWQLPKDPLFLYDESQQSFPYSQYPGLVPKQGQEDSDDDEDDDAGSTILKDPITEITKPRPSGPFRSLTEISSQRQREYFAPRYSSQLGNIGKPAVEDMYGGITGDDDEGSDGSDSESDSEGEHKANNSHIPETRRAGVSSKRK